MAATSRSKRGRLLGQNARSLWYIEQNDAHAQSRSIAHNKIATKKRLQKAGVPTPRLYATIRNRKELAKFRWTKLPSSFVVKPRSAFGGGGIIVVFGRNKKGNWVKADKSEIFIPELRKHTLDILDGRYSTSNAPDVALFEQRIRNHPDLKQYSVAGIADLRVVVYNRVPIMAMLRLPTSESQGKANLHTGGVGIGIDMARGLTTTAILRGRTIDTLPDKKLALAGIRIPHWRASLLTAVKAADAIDISFAGVDIALDRDDGPVVLEVNARPGLDIQLANMAPLLSRLKRVEDLQISSPERGVQIGINLFGGDVEQEIEEVTGQTVLGIAEPVQVFDQAGQAHTITAKIDTGAWRTTVDEDLAKKYGLHTKVVQPGKKVRGTLGRQQRPIIELKINLHDHLITTEAFIADRSHMKYNMIIGRRDLKGFLVDPSKKPHKQTIPA